MPEQGSEVLSDDNIVVASVLLRSQSDFIEKLLRRKQSLEVGRTSESAS
jgi:hypothetical protein